MATRSTTTYIATDATNLCVNVLNDSQVFLGHMMGWAGKISGRASQWEVSGLSVMVAQFVDVAKKYSVEMRGRVWECKPKPSAKREH